MSITNIEPELRLGLWRYYGDINYACGATTAKGDKAKMVPKRKGGRT